MMKELEACIPNATSGEAGRYTALAAWTVVTQFFQQSDVQPWKNSIKLRLAGNEAVQNARNYEQAVKSSSLVSLAPRDRSRQGGRAGGGEGVSTISSTATGHSGWTRR